MAQVLRQSTQVIVVIGPFVDVADGFTPETGVTLSGADEAELLKANTATTTSIAAATWAAITGCDGYYALTLTTSLTDTVGPLTVMVNDDSVCLPVLARFQVIEEAAYDAIYAASAAPATAAGVSAVETKVDTVDTNVDAILVDTGTTLQAELDAIQAAVITNAAGVDIAADIIALKAVADAVLVDTGTTLDGKIDTIDSNVDAILLDTAEIGAAGAGLTAINLPDQTMNITGNITGNLSGSVGSVTGAVGSVTGNVGGTINGLTAAALADFFDTDSGTTYASAVAGSVVAEIADNAGGSSLTAADIADAVWDEAQADHATAGTFGEMATETAAILVDTAEIGAAGAGLTALATQTSVNTVDTVVDAIKVQTDKLTFTVANQVDANAQSINDAALAGAGTAGDPWKAA